MLMECNIKPTNKKNSAFVKLQEGLIALYANLMPQLINNNRTPILIQPRNTNKQYNIKQQSLIIVDLCIARYFIIITMYISPNNNNQPKNNWTEKGKQTNKQTQSARAPKPSGPKSMAQSDCRLRLACKLSRISRICGQRWQRQQANHWHARWIEAGKRRRAPATARPAPTDGYASSAPIYRTTAAFHASTLHTCMHRTCISVRVFISEARLQSHPFKSSFAVPLHAVLPVDRSVENHAAAFSFQLHTHTQRQWPLISLWFLYLIMN